MIGCICCHGPMVERGCAWFCPICDAADLEAFDRVSEQPSGADPAQLPFVTRHSLPSDGQREALTILIEEASEVQKVVTKILRFGLHDAEPGSSERNELRLANELGDLIATAHLCRQMGLFMLKDVSIGVREKFRRLRMFLQTVEARGALEYVDINNPEILAKTELPMAQRAEELQARLNNQARTIHSLQHVIKRIASFEDIEVGAAFQMRKLAQESHEKFSSNWVPTHRHVKTQGLYRELRRGFIERNMEPCVIYENESGVVFVRPTTEFDDGRFEAYTPLSAYKPPSA